MALFSFLRGRAEPGATSSKNTAAHGAAPNSVEEVRTRARRRLIGAAVLVLGSVVGLPMIFESKPREVAADAAVEMPRGDGLPAVIVPVAKAPTIAVPAPVVAASAVEAAPKEMASADTVLPVKPSARPPAAGPIVTEAVGDVGREVLPPTAKPAVKPAATPVVKPEPKQDESAKSERAAAAEARRAKALLEGHESSSKSAKPAVAEKVVKLDKAEQRQKSVEKPADKPAAGSGKFLVQVGAFSQSTSAQAAVDKVEKLGMKAYSQDVETPDGKRTRVRLGPFASREEADRAAARLRAGGQTAAVLPQ